MSARDAGLIGRDGDGWVSAGRTAANQQARSRPMVPPTGKEVFQDISTRPVDLFCDLALILLSIHRLFSLLLPPPFLHLLSWLIAYCGWPTYSIFAVHCAILTTTPRTSRSSVEQGTILIY